ncbi:DEAD/DEAH box helicase [Alcanivorax sp. S71-1-4]|uniref:DEAD/DEAH box helicase n=1 Tax=Alcanivorax sp. S71-1-4 TaxID=1177159 RepID=UPI0013591CFE|nr:DEAD/DEAH box helicase [Alcanivorax sp. S71-1-4]KAF0809048.1 DEAD/DEAH box helicase [Alcanivorax sp. S71-1-4]
MFAELPLHERLLKALAELGFTEPTPVQAAAIPEALAGHDLRVTAQTGSGKTAAFLLPMLHYLIEHPDHRAGTRSLILLPTRELARQTLKHVEQLIGFTYIKAELITGGEDFKVQAARMRKNPDILIGTPGRLLEHLEAGNLDFSDLTMLVLDEADRMLDMGFKDDVLRLAEICNPKRQTLLFSATPGGQALAQVVAAVLREPRELVINTVRDEHANIRHQLVTVDDVGHKERVLRWLLDNETFEKTIIFTNTREQADRLGGVLRTHLDKVYVLHGEKDHKVRKQTLDKLRNGDIRVLVATDVAARGLDIAGLELVINFDVPRSGDEYLHRAGRTGRIGHDGLAITLVAAHEWNLMSSISRYLRLNISQRLVAEHPGHFNGPKKLKASGKAAGSKKKKLKKKTEAKKTGAKKAPAKKAPAKKAVAKKPAPDTQGGYATPRKKPRGPVES